MKTQPAGSPRASDDRAPDPAEVLAELQAIATQLHPHLHGRLNVHLDSQLDRDLGLDSLSRMELMARLEQRYRIGVSERAMAEADTPRDLLLALRQASYGAVAPPLPPVRELAGESAEAAPTGTRTLVEALRWHVDRHPEREHVRLLDEVGAAQTLTYGGLLEAAERIAAGLSARDVEPGTRVAIMLPTQLEYLQAFFAVLLVGAIPVPIYPPARLSQLEDHFRRHAKILGNAGAQWLITFERARQVSRLLTSQVDGLRAVLGVDELASHPRIERVANPDPGHIAFLQYTSGSTGNPKGVVLTHERVIASLDSMAKGLAITPRDVFVSWLPLYHDMGLIGAWLGSLFYGMPLVLMSPLTFLARPVRWLRAIHEHRATLSGGPNFAYELCNRRIEDGELDGLELDSWRVAFNGAEPVSPDTLERFASRFGPYGLRRSVLMPVYGLAEATLGVAFNPLDRGPSYDRVRREPMQTEGRALPAAPDERDALTVVSTGVPIPGFEVRTVDEGGRETAEREAGRIQFRGPSTTPGYYRNPEASAALFAGEGSDWLESGDLGYVAGGEVYVTGRVKDVIIRAGRNLYPYELEQAVGEVAGVRRGCVAVLGAEHRQSGTERLVVVAETRETDSGRRTEISQRIESASLELLGSAPDEVMLVPPHTVLKTSSGKLRRVAIRELYEADRLRPSGGSVGWQVVRLSLAAVAPELRRLRRRLGALAWATAFWSALIPVALVAWAGVVAARRPATGRAVVRGAAGLLLRVVGIPLKLEGVERLPREGAYVLVSNHASYLDGLVLSAALPRIPAFVAKRELADHWFPRAFLRGLGARFVERFDPQRGAEDAGALTRGLAAGGSLAVFVEGTLHRMPGLLPFQLGAFSAAAEARTPVVPVVIRGTRSILRDKSWFPRRGAVRIHICEPIEPPGGDGSAWQVAVNLRDGARERILERCGEPDLADRQALLDLAPGHSPRHSRPAV